MAQPASISSPPHRPMRWLRALAVGAITLPVGTVCLWSAIHRFEPLGPFLADSLRAMVGSDAVAQLEDFTYGVQDRVYRYWRRDELPQSYWEVPPPVAEPVVEAPTEPLLPPSIPAFRPRDVGPVLQAWSAPGDGVWVPIAQGVVPGSPPYLYKTLLHPDPERSWAELFVVVIDLRRTRIFLVPGRREPEPTVVAALEVPRPALIPENDHALVLAAFNGGFKTEHGQYGMQVGEVTFVEPREDACAIAAFSDGSVTVENWTGLAARRSEMGWWRQTPVCMWQNGEMHWRLRGGFVQQWGATLDGETVIRRSAVGASADGRALFVGITNHTSAAVLALGMQHAGAATVAQLDVNWSFPKFVTFEAGEPGGPRRAVALASGFEYSEDEYIRQQALREFFYVMPHDINSPQAQR